MYSYHSYFLLGHSQNVCLPCTVQGKALSMTDQFTLDNTQYMMSSMAAMDFYSKPLLDVCSKKIIGNLLFIDMQKTYVYIVRNYNFLTLQSSHFICFLEHLPSIPFNRLLPVLLSCRKLHYRDLELLNGISDYIFSVIDLWNNKQVLHLSSLHATYRKQLCKNMIVAEYNWLSHHVSNVMFSYII